MELQTYHCSHCGAPLSIPAEAPLLLCFYCKSGYQLVVSSCAEVVREPSDMAARAPSEPVPQLAPSGVSKEQVTEILRLVVEGKQDDAISLYADLTPVSLERAKAAVNDLAQSLGDRLTQRAPLNRFGWLVLPPTSVTLTVATVYAMKAALEGSGGCWLVALICAGPCWVSWKWLVERASTNVTLWLGGHGQGRVVRAAVICQNSVAITLMIQWEVSPTDGSPSFLDEEAITIIPGTLGKYATGNVIPVRFNRKRNLVFPCQ